MTSEQRAAIHAMLNRPLRDILSAAIKGREREGLFDTLADEVKSVAEEIIGDYKTGYRKGQASTHGHEV